MIDPQMIDHTLLRADATEEMIAKLCTEALAYGFKAVCIHPCWVVQAASLLRGSQVAVATVVGFPLGANLPAIKREETARALQEGAVEFDMVLNIGALKSGSSSYVRKEIEEVVAAAEGKVVKVILETCFLTDAEKIEGCRMSKQAGAHFVKTSTGFGGGGATTADVALMRREVGSEMGVKASGGIRDLPTALAMIAQGASRIGTSSGAALVNRPLV